MIDKRIGFSKKKESTNKTMIIPVEVKFLKYSFSIIFLLIILRACKFIKLIFLMALLEKEIKLFLQVKIYKVIY